MIIEKVEWKKRPSEYFVKLDKDSALWLAEMLIKTYRGYLPSTFSFNGVNGIINFSVVEKMSDYKE